MTGRYKTKRRDKNQGSIIWALRKAGASVLDLSQVGGGCPDLLVGYRLRNYLLEVKDSSPVSERQTKWAEGWKGRPRAIVRTPEEALISIGAMKP